MEEKLAGSGSLMWQFLSQGGNSSGSRSLS